jgi:hypothetical protein
MNLKKIIPYLILFILLGGATVVIQLKSRNSAMDKLKAERDFRVAQPESIGKVFLVHRDGEQVLLERKGKQWTYNGEWTARPDAIQNLLDALSRLQVLYKPAAAAVPNMVRSLATEGIKVEIYDRRGKLLKAYYVGGGTVDERGVFVIREGFEQPYVAHLDAWEGNPRFRYNLKGEDWRDRSIFKMDADRIMEVGIEYPAQRNQSFRLSKTQGGFEIRPFFPVTPRIQAPVRPGAVEQFLAGFESIVAEDFRNTFPARDSILQTLPFAVITVKIDKEKEESARLYPIFQEPTSPGGQDGPVERYFVSTSSGDFMLAQHRVLKKILWGYPFFFNDN